MGRERCRCEAQTPALKQAGARDMMRKRSGYAKATRPAFRDERTGKLFVSILCSIRFCIYDLLCCGIL